MALWPLKILPNHCYKKDEQLDYIKEDCLFDLSVYYSEKFENIYSYDVDGKATKINTKSNTTNAILIEHENNILLAYEEMIKLTYVKAKLKVIISYDRWNDIEFAKERLSNNLKQIVYQANQRITESLSTEYLIIVGQNKGDKIFWDCSAPPYSVTDILQSIK